MRLKLGETVTLEGFGLCVVMDTTDSAFTALKLPSGRVVRFGHRTIERLRIDDRNEDLQPDPQDRETQAERGVAANDDIHKG